MRLLEAFAYRYPTTVFVELMGLRSTACSSFQLEHGMLHDRGSSDAPARRGGDDDGCAGFVLSDLCGAAWAAARRSGVAVVDVARIDGEPIAESDLFAWCLLMFMAGLDTVTSQLSCMFWHLGMWRRITPIGLGSTPSRSDHERV